MHNGYCFGLGSKFGTPTEITDPETQTSDVTISDYDRLRVWFDKRDIASYSNLPIMLNSHGPVNQIYERNHRNPLQITYQNERYQFNALIHGTTKPAQTWDQIELGTSDQVEVFFGKNNAQSQIEYITGFKLQNSNDDMSYTIPSYLESEINYNSSLYRSETGDDFAQLGGDDTVSKVVGFVTTQNGTSVSSRLTSLQFIYLTESQEVCNHFSETLYVDRIFHQSVEQTEWFHWSYIVAVVNFLVFILATCASIWCCKRLVKTQRSLRVAKKLAVSPMDLTGKSLNTVHVLNEKPDNEKYTNEQLNKETNNYDNTLKKLDDEPSQDSVVRSSSDEDDKQQNQEDDLQISNSARDIDIVQHSSDKKQVQFDDSPRMKSISIQEINQENLNKLPKDINSNSKLSQQSSSKSRQSVEVIPQNSGLANIRSSLAMNSQTSIN